MDVRKLQNILRRDPGVDGDAQRIAQLTTLMLLKALSEQSFRNESPPPELLTHARDIWASLSFWSGSALTLKRGLERLKSLHPDDDEWGAIAHDLVALPERDETIRDLMVALSETSFVREDRDNLGYLYEQLISGLGRSRSAGEFYTPRPIIQLMLSRMNLRGGETIIDPACGSGGFLIQALEISQQLPRKLNLMGFELKRLPHLLATANSLFHGGSDSVHVIRGDGLEHLRTSIAKADVIVTNPPFGSLEIDAPEWLAHYRTRDTTALFVAAITDHLPEGGKAAIVVPEGFLYSGAGVQRIRSRLITEGWISDLIRLPNSVFSPYTGISTNILFIDKGRKAESVRVYWQPLPPGYKAFSKTKPIEPEHLAGAKAWLAGESQPGQERLVSNDEIAKNDYRLDLSLRPTSTTFALGPDILSDLEQAEGSLEHRLLMLHRCVTDWCGETAETVSWGKSLKFFWNDHTQLWRIWQRIVRASLSGQVDPLRSPKEHGQSDRSEERPFSLRAGWHWSTVGSFGRIVGGGTPPSGIQDNFAEQSGVPWVTPADLRDLRGRTVMNGRRFLSGKGLAASSAELLPEGSVLFSSRAPIGYVAIAGQELATNQGFKSVVPNDAADIDYLFYYLRHATDLANDLASGTTFKELSGAKMRTLPTPIGPREEMVILTEFWSQTFNLMEAIVDASQALSRNVLMASELLAA